MSTSSIYILKAGTVLKFPRWTTCIESPGERDTVLHYDLDMFD